MRLGELSAVDVGNGLSVTVTDDDLSAGSSVGICTIQVPGN